MNIPEPNSAQNDEAINRLHSATGVIDPTDFYELLDQRDHTTVEQARRLWEIAVKQSILADLAVANGDEGSQAITTQQFWAGAAEGLRTALAPLLGGDDPAGILRDYWTDERAAAAVDGLIASVQRFETMLSHQLGLIQLHWDDENPYRQRERELSAQIEATGNLDSAAAIGKQVLAENARYRRILLPRLIDTNSVLKVEFQRCERFVAMFPVEHYPSIHRWQTLTASVLASRDSAVAHIMQALDFDAYLPTEVVAGNVTRDSIEGTSQWMLNADATARVKRYTQTAITLIEQSSGAEAAIADERDELAKQLVGDSSPSTPSTPSSNSDNNPPEVIAAPRTHPLERKAWFRLARVCWWTALALLLLFASVATPTWTAFFISAVVIGSLLVGLKMLAFYILLGRATLHERPGSGFIDLAEFEEEIIGKQSIIEPSDRFATVLRDLRSRYGHRVPANVLRAVVDRELSTATADKRRVLADADREGRTIRVADLRHTLEKQALQRPEGIEREAFRLSCESLLTRLEIKYGPEIPVSAADEEADGLMASRLSTP